jgi:hypothetical protein
MLDADMAGMSPFSSAVNTLSHRSNALPFSTLPACRERG